MVGSSVTVIKLGKIMNIAEDDLQQGDILLLQAGDLVPADLKLVEARGLEVDEWELTGEILPTEKRVDEDDVRIYRGSSVTRGSGKGVVIATGEGTEYGHISKQSQEVVSSKFPSLINGTYFVLPVLLAPPCIVALGQDGNQALICLLAVIVAGLLILLQNDELFRYVLTSSQLKKLEHQRIQMLDAAALNVMAYLNIVCFDKTGVLTTRDIEVSRIHFADGIADLASFVSSGEIVDLTKVACTLCNDVFFIERMNQANPIDRALLAFALKNGIDLDRIVREYRRIYDKPFDSENRYMVSGFEVDNKTLFLAKGDPEVVLRMCADYISESGTIKPARPDFLLSIRFKADAINQQGDIAIALAYHSAGDSAGPPSSYTFLCLIQLENPLKPGVRDVVTALKDIGIKTVMVTGDRPEAALEVGRRSGIDRRARVCLTGKHMATMGSSDIALQSAYISIFARLLPSHKGILIRVFQRERKIVAMVGDGANDAIALRAANVGLSFVENSSPFAKRASKILINDLADLLTLIQCARELEWQVEYLKLFKVITVTVIMCGSYLWMLSRIF